MWPGANYSIPCQHPAQAEARGPSWRLCVADLTAGPRGTAPAGPSPSRNRAAACERPLSSNCGRETSGCRRREENPQEGAWWAKEPFYGGILSLNQRSGLVWGPDGDPAEASKLPRCWARPAAQRWTLNHSDSNKPWHLSQEISNSHLASLSPSYHQELHAPFHSLPLQREKFTCLIRASARIAQNLRRAAEIKRAATVQDSTVPLRTSAPGCLQTRLGKTQFQLFLKAPQTWILPLLTCTLNSLDLTKETANVNDASL